MSGATFKPSDAVDFLVIGAGAAGGVMAKELSTAGLAWWCWSRVRTSARKTTRMTRSSTPSSRG